MNPPASLCILRLSALGDVSHIVPIVRTIQKYWPQTLITWVVGKLEYALVGDIDGVEFIVFEKAWGLAAYRAVWQELRDRRFDVLLMMQVALRASLLSLGIRATLKIGFDRVRAKDGQWLFSHQGIAHKKNQHVLDSFFGFLQVLGLQERVLRWDIPLHKDSQHFAKNQLGDTPVLVINPCSSSRMRNFRNWRAGRYAAVAEYAYHTYGLQTVLTGGSTANEKDMANTITCHARVDMLNLVGVTTIAQLHAVLAQAQVVIAPDTGPLHIASVAGTPVIGLYATTNPDRTGPYNSLQWVVNRYPQAVERYLGESVDGVRWGTRVRNPEALDLIKVGDVTGQLDRIMSAN